MKKWLIYAGTLLATIGILILGTAVFQDKQYTFLSLAAAGTACVPFLWSFERRDTAAARVVLLAVMVALSVLGRTAFAAVPSFKPVTAMVVIAGLYLGGEAGFLCGALSALLSNFVFGQGPWTPFQMLAWGLVGLLAGLLSRPLKKHFWLLLIYGALSGVAYSLLMDVWTVLSMDGTFLPARYFAAIIAALPVTATYVVSNVIFLLVLALPLGRVFDRVRQKYGIG